MASPIRRLIHSVGPVHLAGLTFPDWIRLLRANHWKVDAPFLPRAVLVTLGSIMTSALKIVEDASFSDTCDESLLQRPVFILGLPRSGTTHLFQMIAASQAFGYPSRLDAFYPHVFRTLHRLGIPRLLSLIPAQKRMMDDVPTSWLSPEEDSLALCVLAGQGRRLVASFPSTRQLCDHDPASSATALRTFSRRLVQVYRKPLLFKSPQHTGHVEEILTIFPEARFVTIFRNPLHQNNSQRQAVTSDNKTWGALQRGKPNATSKSLQTNRLFLSAYFAQRTMIPTGHLMEILYEDLILDAAATLQRVYQFLGIADAPIPVPREKHQQRPLSSMPLTGIDEFLDTYKDFYDRGIYERPTRESLERQV